MTSAVFSDEVRYTWMVSAAIFGNSSGENGAQQANTSEPCRSKEANAECVLSA